MMENSHDFFKNQWKKVMSEQKELKPPLYGAGNWLVLDGKKPIFQLTLLNTSKRKSNFALYFYTLTV